MIISKNPVKNAMNKGIYKSTAGLSLTTKVEHSKNTPFIATALLFLKSVMTISNNKTVSKIAIGIFPGI